MGQPKFKPQEKSEIICFCNNVPRHVIEKAIREGSDDLNKIFDSTMAGVGACGGSCRRKLAPMLESFQSTGTFPNVIHPDMTGKKSRRG